MAKTTMKALGKILKEFTKNTGDRPYAFFCNKETFEKIEREARTGLSAPQTLYKFDRNNPLSICFDGIPIFKSKGCLDDKIYIVDKETSLRIMAHKFFWGDGKKELSREELMLALAIVFKDAGKTPQEKDLFDKVYQQINGLIRLTLHII